MQQSPSLATFRYSVLVGQDEAFETWLRNLLMLVVAAPGFIGVSRAAQESPPDASCWKITYKFESGPDRESWMHSPALAKAHAQAADLFASSPQATADAEGGASRMTMVVTSHVPPGRKEDWRTAQARLNASVVGFPGFDGLEIFKPSDDSHSWTTVLTFRSERDLENWKHSADRGRLLSRFEETKHDRVDVGPTSFGTWFAARATASRSTPEWKQAMVVLAVLYPLVSFYDITLGNAAGQGLAIAGHQIIKGLGLPFPVVVFLGNAIGTVLLTWVLMPAAIGLFNWWLDPAASREQTIRGAFMLVALYVLEVAAFSYVFETWGF
jgi:antibiotic biosynthesis monooxygenase (ABM) superfamily enzyme